MRKHGRTLRTWGIRLAVGAVFAGMFAGVVWRQYERDRRDRELIAAIKRVDSRAVTTLLDQGAYANTLLTRASLETKDSSYVWAALRHVLLGMPHGEPVYGIPALWVDLDMAENDTEDKKLSDPVRHARGREEERIAEALILHGSELFERPSHFDRSTPLHKAALLDWPNTARLLLARSAKVDARLHEGETPLMFAHTEITALLLQNGADPNARTYEGKTPLMLPHVEPSKVRLLLDAGANPNAKDRDGNTPLMAAESPETIAMLLQNGADIHARNKAGHTALYHLQHGSVMGLKPETQDQMVRLLMARGAHE